MKQSYKIFAITIITIIVALGIAIGYPQYAGKNDETQMPKDFGFVFRFGVEGKNVIDTFNGKFTKDMVIDPSITTNLKFTNEQMKMIYKRMNEIDIYNYPSKYEPKSNTFITPYSTYYIKIKANGIQKEIYWKDEHNAPDRSSVKLRKLFKEIEQMIYDSDEYKKLPMPNGGYD